MKKVWIFFVEKIKLNIISVNIISIIFTLLCVFGTSYYICGTANLIFKNIIHIFISSVLSLILFLIFKFLLNLLFVFLDSDFLYKTKNVTSKIINKYEKHPFIYSMVFMLICWLPYIISYYPSILAPDPAYQIMQFFGYENKFANSFYSVDFNPLITTITNHHPVFHTLIIGTCVKIGQAIGNVNFGLFIYSFAQILVLSSVLSLTLKKMKEMNIPSKVRMLFLLIYSLVPMFPLYAMNPVKDVMFTILVILYILFLIDIVLKKKEKITLKRTIYISLILILLILFRHNGLYLIMLSLPLTLIVSKINIKRIVSIFVIVMSFNFIHNNIVLPHFQIVPSSIKEVLSIPFQQTARYVKYYKNEITEEEYKAIDNVLGMSDLAERYNPENADPVKDNFNKYASVNKQYLKDYFKVWLNCFFKHPTVYIDATINNIYGYFYPIKTNWYVYYKTTYNNQEDINDYGFDYHFNSLDSTRNILSTYAKNFQYIPIIGWICNIGLNTWTLFILIGYLIYKKKNDGLIVLMPSIITLLTCVISPVNCYYRYVLPYIFAMPIVISFVLYYTRRSSYEK